MTNSTDKKKKKKGPLRSEAIIPLLVLVILFGAYFKYFFDSHLLKGLEFGATQLHGAEVNIRSLRTSFLEPSIRLFKIEVTDKSNPEFNYAEVGEVKLQLLWDGLLRGKFVIPESSILGIQVQSKRDRKGRILPKDTSSGESGVISKAADKTINQLQEKHEKNLLGDVFSIASGTNYKDQLKKMESQLKSQEKLKTLEKELKLKEKEWNQKLKDLPDESEIKQLVKKLDGLKFDGKNLANSLKVIDQVYREASTKYKTLEGAKKAFDQDIKRYNSEYKGLEAMIQKDIQSVTEKMNIPSLDPSEINKMLLGNLVAQQLGGLMKYKNMAREVMPTKTAEQRRAEKNDVKLTPIERANGINYSFVKKKSYPRIWLQLAKISSTSANGAAGDLNGTLKNLTDNPRHLGKPATLEFSGDFPHQKIMGVKGLLTVDHTTEVPTETGQISAKEFPVKGNKLTQSKDVNMSYKDTSGSAQVNFELKDQALSMKTTSLFNNMEYDVSATDKNVKRLLNGVVNDLRKLNLNVRASGSWDNVSLHINSNLGKKMSAAIKKQISGEINRAKKEVENHVRSLVGGEKQKLNNEFKKLEKQTGLSLKSKEDAIKSVKTTADKKVNDAKKKEQKKVEKKAKKELNKLLKGIKF